MKIFKESFNPWCLARTDSSQVTGKFVGKFQMLYFIAFAYWKHDTIIHNKFAKEKKARKWGLIEHLINNSCGIWKTVGLNLLCFLLSPFIMFIDVNEGLHVLIPYENRTKT